MHMFKLFLPAILLLASLSTTDGLPHPVRDVPDLEEDVPFSKRRAHLDSLLQVKHLKNGYVVLDSAGRYLISGEMKDGLAPVMETIGSGTFHLYLQADDRVIDLVKW